ncbi:hypothetical protein PVL30_004317 [Lodderomyces elongisporus]|uniref:Uncharacterized protein n=1 Tax=Lodderomyces elongisporus (strain ATCC 11503 / CBS 2605 / JCM 1781 / NBRC 1676 / NRRL YB-4239) TaxID=379508 RepID=A5E4Q8_LODEL|nr:uncharacterized protein PVL30_004317 [Lodderomyces elongisporus]EDK46416.1 conserved hypothetical protein [Lodderomyces elongisporus NRRL YB-4239]WLF80533.1 hypothetical protein PVL30_004317 [Lodderomyces elongisporus]
MSSFTIPDLRFEQSFWRQLNAYAGNTMPTRKISTNKLGYGSAKGLTDEELELLNADIDKEEERYLNKPQPLAPVTPGIVVYAIVKDQIIMPFLQGLFLTGFLISIRPILAHVVRNGQHVGRWMYNLLGLDQLSKNRRIVSR